MSEAASRRNHHPRPLNQPARQALRLWLALHNLSRIMEPLSGHTPNDHAITSPDPSSNWPTPQMPPNQMAYQEWLLTAATIFQCESLPDSPIFTVEAPAVKRLVVYGARCGTIKLYAAWVETAGTFTGWLKILQAIEGVDSDFGVGEVFGKPLDSKTSMDIKGHLAVDRFVRELGKVAWAVGAVED